MTPAPADAGRLASDARAIWGAAVAAAAPPALLADGRWQALAGRRLDAYRRVLVLAVGKAAMGMAGAVEAALGDRVSAGVATVPRGYAATLPTGWPRPERVQVLEAGHPLPDAASLRAARRALDLAAGADADDLVLALVSGGGSALWAAPAAGLTLADLEATARLLLRAGVPISDVNGVRRMLSDVKNGGLARAAAPAEVVTLVLSDVPGDDPATVASGPTVALPAADGAAAREVLRRARVWGAVSERVRAHLERCGHEGAAAGPTRVVGTNADALAGAEAEARRRGYRPAVVAGALTGEARAAGERLAAAALEAGPGCCLVRGGETTVTVRGDGRGGRNQEVALAAALRLADAHRAVAALSGGTDGIDGPTDAAGAVVTGETVAAAQARGLEAADALARNDTYPFFAAAGGHILTGPTHTNVMDVAVACVG